MLNLIEKNEWSLDILVLWWVLPLPHYYAWWEIRFGCYSGNHEHMKKEWIISDYLLNTIENTLVQSSTLNSQCFILAHHNSTEGLSISSSCCRRCSHMAYNNAIESHQTSFISNLKSVLIHRTLIWFYFCHMINH